MVTRIHITGICGGLGSTLAKFFLERGFEVQGNDILRFEEVLHFKDFDIPFKYLWKATQDLTCRDIKGVDLVIDASITSADRPFPTNSPTFSLGNLDAPLHLLEVVRRMKRKPIVCYPSSLNAYYGYPPGTTFKEDMLPNPISIYGWTKACASMLYQVYHKCFDVPIIITVTGSTFGEGGRVDELPHKLIVHCLKDKPFLLRSPLAKRLWTYKGDVLKFYEKLVERIDELIGETLFCMGNKGDVIVTNLELANMIKKLTNSDIPIVESGYEPGELVDGKPIDFKVDPSYTRKILGWKPKYTLEEGLKKTIEWFKKNIDRYNVRFGLSKLQKCR